MHLNRRNFVELTAGGTERYSNWFDPPLEIRDGSITVPKGPGVGIKDIGELLKGAKPVI